MIGQKNASPHSLHPPCCALPPLSPLVSAPLFLPSVRRRISVCTSRERHSTRKPRCMLLRLRRFDTLTYWNDTLALLERPILIYREYLALFDVLGRYYACSGAMDFGIRCTMVSVPALQLCSSPGGQYGSHVTSFRDLCLLIMARSTSSATGSAYDTHAILWKVGALVLTKPSWRSQIAHLSPHCHPLSSSTDRWLVLSLTCGHRNHPSLSPMVSLSSPPDTTSRRADSGTYSAPCSLSTLARREYRLQCSRWTRRTYVAQRFQAGKMKSQALWRRYVLCFIACEEC